MRCCREVVEWWALNGKEEEALGGWLLFGGGATAQLKETGA